jgi:hypothetical protein
MKTKPFLLQRTKKKAIEQNRQDHQDKMNRSDFLPDITLDYGATIDRLILLLILRIPYIL